MEKPKESPQEAFEKKLEETKDFGVAKGMVEDELKKLEESENRGESVNPEWQDFLKRKNDELRESILGEAGR